MDSNIKEIKVTGQGFGTPEPVGKDGGRAGLLRPSANYCSSETVGDQAKSATGKTEEIIDPFKRKSSIARTPPQKERLQSCPDALFRAEAHLEKPETPAERLDKEEKLAFEGLGKNLVTMYEIVKDARNIHKQIRDAVTAAMIHYQRLKDVRGEREKDKAAPNSPSGGKTGGKKTLTQVHNRMTQTEMLSNTKLTCQESQTTQTEAIHHREDEDIVQGGNKKRTASSSPSETSKQGKRVRVTQRIDDKIPDTERISLERNQKEPEWEMVEHRKRRKKKEQTEQTSGTPGNTANRTKRSQARRRLPEAVAVKINDGATYANVLKDLKTKVDPQRIGLQVRGIRKTRAGEILIELQNGGGKAEELRATVATALGQGACVRTLDRTISLVVKDLDGTTEEAEVVEAIKAVVAEHDRDSIKVRSLRKTFGETQAAVVTMSSRAAEAVTKRGRIKIGWVMCRVRERVEVARCFRCLDFGHIARECKGTDRTNICRLCGEGGHRAKDCKSDPLCVICKENKEPGGANHISGSARCGSFRREVGKTRK